MLESMNPACSALAESYLLSLPVPARLWLRVISYPCPWLHGLVMYQRTTSVLMNTMPTSVLRWWWQDASERPVASLTGTWRRANGCRNRGTYWW